jgi:hypothetical protein
VTTIRDAFSGSLASLQNINDFGWISGLDANIFVANHDTERDGSSLRYDSPNNMYTNAMVFSLSYPYGRPTILSSFVYNNSDDGAPLSGWLNVSFGFSSFPTNTRLRRRNLLWCRRRQQLAMPAPMACRRGAGRLPQHGRIQ